MVEIILPTASLYKAPFCPFCSEPNNRTRSTDHLVPCVAVRTHENLLLPIKNLRVNKVSLCIDHHKNVDEGLTGKISRLTQKGLAGLFESIASYPRAKTPGLLYTQHEQWVTLAELLKRQFDGLNGRTPSMFKEQYQIANELIESFLLQWRDKGNFVTELPKP